MVRLSFKSVISSLKRLNSQVIDREEFQVMRRDEESMMRKGRVLLEARGKKTKRNYVISKKL